MTPRIAADRLRASGAAIQALLADVDAELGRWRPAEGKWSLVEIACHLLDEESADFRARFALLLAKSEEPFAPIDPEGWARDRGYRERALPEVLAELARERAESLAWLRGLTGWDLAAERTAPWGGQLAAGDVLAAWVDHDLVHMRQMLGVLHARANEDAAPHSTEYAGGAW